MKPIPAAMKTIPNTVFFLSIYMIFDSGGDVWLTDTFQVWNRIVATGMPGVAAENPAQAEPEAMKEAMAQQRLPSVAGARRLKTTTAGCAKQNLLQGG
jgi:hypothetical protein